MVWNARSHAAYHGYSHLSGIEMMCSFTMWNHSLFRIGFCARPHRIDAMFLEPLVHVETEVLLAPQHPGQRLPHDEGLIFTDPLRSDGSIELVRLRWRVCMISAKLSNGSPMAAGARSLSRSRIVAVSPAPTLT